MIIFNERGDKKDNIDTIDNITIDTNQNYRTYIGIGLGLSSCIVLSGQNISAKVLLNEKMENDEQIYYISLLTIIFSLIYIILFESFEPVLDIKINLMNIISGVYYFIWMNLYLYSIKNIDLSKLTGISYISTLMSFILSSLFLGEHVFLTDVLGSIIVLCYNIYNAKYPPVD